MGKENKQTLFGMMPKFSVFSSLDEFERALTWEKSVQTINYLKLVAFAKNSTCNLSEYMPFCLLGRFKLKWNERNSKCHCFDVIQNLQYIEKGKEKRKQLRK